MIGQRLLLLAGILLGFALRLHRLGAESLWYDESVSVHLARKPIAEMLAHTAGDIHPPGYYLLLHLWGQLTAPSLAHGLEFLYAWPSLFAGLLLLALIYALGRRLFDAPTALIGVWLAAVSPFQLWYSQEVRMYTVGAALALLCLWAALRFVERRNPRRWLVLYALAAAAGMYTLYYFAFWLIGVNVVVLWLLWRGEGRVARGDVSLLVSSQRSRSIAAWLGAQLGAQLGALLLFAPWLPIFVRQAVDPPVPPWRTPWDSATAFLASLGEMLAALVVGQSPPGDILWPWALLTAVTVVVALFVQRRKGTPRTRFGLVVVSLVVALPILLLFLLTAVVTPVYHVRYLSLYTPIFVLVPAFVVRASWRTQRSLAVAALLVWIAVSLAASTAFWTEPRYRADDHRAAVAAVAEQWRPGDVLLVNAGWIYPVLTTYWPVELRGVDGVLPLELGDLLSIHDYAQRIVGNPNFADEPTVARSGSVDGPATLGWGNPGSDFFAISSASTVDALTTIAEHSRRIWHYRLYDTVSDPSGVIRRWLAENTTLLAETPIPGRDFGAVQLFATHAPLTDAVSSQDSICFGDVVCLRDYAQISTQKLAVEAGSFLYLEPQWQAPEWQVVHPTDAQPGTPSLPELAVSLRIYDRSGRLAAQSDAPFTPSSAGWQAGDAPLHADAIPVALPLALPISVSTKPGDYSLEMVVYRHETGEALSLPAAAPSPDGQRLQLGTLTAQPSSRIPTLPTAQASFDYIDLIEARFDRTTARPGDTLSTAFFWRPRPSSYRDDYTVVLTMTNDDGAPAHEWRFPLGGEYPSGAWQPALPVRDFYDLTLPESLPPGEYTISAALHRTRDDAPIPVRRGWLPAQAPNVATVRVETD